MTELSVLERLRLVEASVDVQSEILTEIQAELIEADRLATSVEQLGVGADALGRALLQVDKTQQAMSRLGRELAQVKADSVTNEQVAEQVRRSRRERRLIWIAVGSAAFVGLVGLLTLSHSAYETCERRHEAVETTAAVLESFGDHQRIRAGAARLRATIAVPCARAYPIHL